MSTITEQFWKDPNKTFTREEVENLLRKLVYDNEGQNIFEADYWDDGDGRKDFMGIEFNEPSFELWKYENLQ